MISKGFADTELSDKMLDKLTWSSNTFELVVLKRTFPYLSSDPFRGLLIVTELMAYKLNLQFFQSGNSSVFQNIFGRLVFKDLLN